MQRQWVVLSWILPSVDLPGNLQVILQLGCVLDLNTCSPGQFVAYAGSLLNTVALDPKPERKEGV